MLYLLYLYSTSTVPVQVQVLVLYCNYEGTGTVRRSVLRTDTQILDVRVRTFTDRYNRESVTKCYYSYEILISILMNEISFIYH